jgi:FlaA1/EpsC-like NDP-sugar epimerase
VIALTGAYALVIALSITFAFLLRFDFDIPRWLIPDLHAICTVAVCVHLLCLFPFRQFDGLLSYFSTPDLKRLMLASGSAVLVMAALRLALGVNAAPPRGVILMHYCLSVMGISAMRLSFRGVRGMVYKTNARRNGRARRVGIVGAGDCGAALAKDLLTKPWLKLKPVTFFDDNHRSGCSVHGVAVVGHTNRILEFKRKLEIDEIIIAMPSASPKRIREVLKLCRDAGLSCRTVPSLGQLATGHVSVSNLRPVEIHDLLGRAPVEMMDKAVRSEIQGRIVMVTGAGGSIGSELCRQILSFGPSKLVLVERSEPQLFSIEQELRGEFTSAELRPVVADITRSGRMREVFRRFRPAIVFHAAAHKHVPMMEMQPDEAIRNNVFGTALLADLAVEYAVERFIHISTDKAVNPTNVMGATKRLAEMYIQSLSTRLTKTKFMAVRFGNVLGSSGSVVPTFKRQIAAGGPITVTHPDVTRFFMTIPEAVSLVLQSSTLGKGGDIFVLDMGKPVRIVDLAMQMIALSGLTPHKDIEIAFTGLRPGEKLYEELSHGGESVTATTHPKITRLVAPPLHCSYVGAFMSEMSAALDESHADPATLKEMMARMLPEYTPFLPAVEKPQIPVDARASTRGEMASAGLAMASAGS